MAQGRKTKPTKLKELDGNPGKRPLNKDEPQYELTNVDPPEYFPEIAREAWLFFAPRLINTKILTDVDLHNLEAFCMAYQRWRDAEADVMINGIVMESGGRVIVEMDDDGNETGSKIVGASIVKNPAVTVINESLRQMATFGAMLGLDPSSRTRLIAPKGAKSNPFKNL